MATKLDAGQKHFLRLIVKDAASDGWTPVSSQVLPLARAIMPPELVDIESVGSAGRGRARLTDAGRNIMAAMEWL
jgi:hypothetical protein